MEPRHFTFENDEGSEFEAGTATTRIDVQYMLDYIAEGIKRLDYQNYEDEQLLRKVEIALQEIVRNEKRLISFF